MRNLKLDAESRVALIRAKTERAKEHLRSMEEQLVSYRDRTRPVGFEDGVLELPVLSFRILTTAGDVIHNLRSALDHLAHQLVLVGNPNGSPPRKIEFPILDSQAEYERRKASKTEGMRADAVQAIDELRPYKEGNLALWKLRELDNIDKHRMILSVGDDCLLEGPWVGDFPYLHKALEPHFDAVLDSPDVNLRNGEVIGDPKIIERKTLHPTLRELVLFVEYIIEKFKPCLEATQVPSSNSAPVFDFRQLG
jgi:hypothetical protein